jgi:GNAT superfamily N-acetyltransferase
VLAITRAGKEALDRLAPLWLLLHAHHQAVGGEALGPYVDDEASWRAPGAPSELVAEIETLSVLPAERGAGVGSALLDRSDSELEAIGVADVMIGAFVTNADAIRLYERRGFRPAWLYMLRLGGRSA